MPRPYGEKKLGGSQKPPGATVPWAERWRVGIRCASVSMGGGRGRTDTKSAAELGLPGFPRERSQPLPRTTRVRSCLSTSSEPSGGSSSLRIKDEVLPVAHNTPEDLRHHSPASISPHSLLQTHWPPQLTPVTGQARFCLRTFALAFPLPGTLPAGFLTWLLPQTPPSTLHPLPCAS